MGFAAAALALVALGKAPDDHFQRLDHRHAGNQESAKLLGDLEGPLVAEKQLAGSREVVGGRSVELTHRTVLLETAAAGVVADFVGSLGSALAQVFVGHRSGSDRSAAFPAVAAAVPNNALDPGGRADDGALLGVLGLTSTGDCRKQPWQPVLCLCC